MTFVVFIEKKEKICYRDVEIKLKAVAQISANKKNRKKFLFGWFRLFLWWLVVVMYFLLNSIMLPFGLVEGSFTYLQTSYLKVALLLM